MNGTELLQALLGALAVRLPDCEVRGAFSGRGKRLLRQPAVVLELLEEVRKPGESVPDVRLGVTLYAPPGAGPADLLSEVCDALSGIGAPVRSVTRGKMRFDSAAGCVVAECTVRTGQDGTDGKPRAELSAAGVRLTAGSVRITENEKRREYGAVGEETPHTVRRTSTYTLRLTDVSDLSPFRFGRRFAVAFDGVRYGDCAVTELNGENVTLLAARAAEIGQEAEHGGI